MKCPVKPSLFSVLCKRHDSACRVGGSFSCLYRVAFIATWCFAIKRNTPWSTTAMALPFHDYIRSHNGFPAQHSSETSTKAGRHQHQNKCWEAWICWEKYFLVENGNSYNQWHYRVLYRAQRGLESSHMRRNVHCLSDQWHSRLELRRSVTSHE